MNKDSSLCGFECLFRSDSDVLNFLHFSNLSLDEHYFYVADSSLVFPHTHIDIPHTISPGEFSSLVDKTFWAERLVLHLYSQGDLPIQIDNYDDFLKSNCVMIILVYDVCYLEIYCKNPTWLQQLMYTARNIPAAQVDEKFVDTDTRTSMCVW